MTTANSAACCAALRVRDEVARRWKVLFTVCQRASMDVCANMGSETHPASYGGMPATSTSTIAGEPKILEAPLQVSGQSVSKYHRISGTVI